MGGCFDPLAYFPFDGLQPQTFHEAFPIGLDDKVRTIVAMLYSKRHKRRFHHSVPSYLSPPRPLVQQGSTDPQLVVT